MTSYFFNFYQRYVHSQQKIRRQAHLFFVFVAKFHSTLKKLLGYVDQLHSYGQKKFRREFFEILRKIEKNDRKIKKKFHIERKKIPWLYYELFFCYNLLMTFVNFIMQNQYCQHFPYNLFFFRFLSQRKVFQILTESYFWLGMYV